TRYGDLDPAFMPEVAGLPPGFVTVKDSLTAFQARYNPSGSKRAIKFYSNADIDGVVFTFNGYDVQGNSHWNLVWHSAVPPTRLLIEFGAHVAVGNDTLGAGVGYGVPLGASDINGGPYHVKVRSEERRVGKEWRCRWVADQCRE